MKRILFASLVAACTLLFGGENAQALLIDSFDTPQSAISPGPGTASLFAAGVTGPDIIGFERDLLVLQRQVAT